jgi:hypothetical protein
MSPDPSRSQRDRHKPRFLCLLSCTPNNCRIAPLKLVSWDTRKLADLPARPLPDRPEP